MKKANRTLILIAILSGLSGCVVSPRIEISETLNFDAPMPDQTPLSYADLLCCYECNA